MNKRQSARRRRRRDRRVKLMLTGVLAAGCLLAGVGRAMGDTPRAAPTPAVSFVIPAEPAPVVPREVPSQAPVLQEDDWRLLLVNPWNPLPEDYQVVLTQLKNGLCVDSRCYPDLQAMMDDCRAAGLSPVVCSAYRTQEKQRQLFQNQVDKLLAQGYTQADAEAEAGTAVAVPGTSEHQLGLAVDIVDVNDQNLDEDQEDTAVQQWLMKHSWEYGFILRYPGDKSEITGIIYEPWHYRYVGREAAEEIHEQGVCLEEYLDGKTA